MDMNFSRTDETECLWRTFDKDEEALNIHLQGHEESFLSQIIIIINEKSMVY